jgi:hypothetical protein
LNVAYINPYNSVILLIIAKYYEKEVCRDKL